MKESRSFAVDRTKNETEVYFIGNQHNIKLVIYVERKGEEHSWEVEGGSSVTS